MRLTRIFVEQALVSGKGVGIPEQAGLHLTRVLRLEAGARVTLFDGTGGEYEGTLERDGKKIWARVGAHSNLERESPLEVTLTLPPAPYARRGGEVVAAQLAKVGVNAKIDNVEWAQWLSGAYKGNFDLTIINHVEPLDYLIYTDPKYYYGYDSTAFREIVRQYASSTNPKERTRLFGDLQRRRGLDLYR